MVGLENWLWQTPYLDLPNYALVASGLGLAVLVLYLIILLTTEPKKSETETTTETAPSPEPSPTTEPARQETPEPKPITPTPKPAAPKPKEKPQPTAPRKEKPKTPKPPSTTKPAAPEKPTVPEKPTAPEEPAPKPEPPPKPKPEPEPEPEPIELTPPEGWLTRLKNGLSKTQGKLSQGLSRLLARGKVDQELMDELEELLITSDLGVKTSQNLLAGLEIAVKEQNLDRPEKVKEWLKQEIEKILLAVEAPLEIPEAQEGPFVIMVTGVNGTGKTTTIGKLALRFRDQGKSVLLAAADTFRAAAIQQLEVWGKRANCPIIKHKEGADPGAVAFDAVKAAKARGAQVVIIDTAGRLHTKANLMEELKKVKRVVSREMPGAPQETILVLDATNGQNAIQQAKIFNQELELSGIIMTKLDGTAKGGIIVAISDEFKIPIRFIGVGEKIYDLQPFRARDFVSAIFNE